MKYLYTGYFTTGLPKNREVITEIISITIFNTTLALFPTAAELWRFQGGGREK
jgi:hypothetical protein